MDKKNPILIIVMLFLVFTFSLHVSGEKQFVPNRVVVKMKAVEKAETSGETAGREPGQLVKETHPAAMLQLKYRPAIQGIHSHRIKDYYIIDTVEGCDVEALSETLRHESSVIDASPDYYAVISSTVPNDPYFQYQYSLINVGQVFLPESGLSGTSGSDIKATEGWDWATGSEEVIIAIVDSGVASDHEDLEGKVLPGRNYVDNSDNAYDDHGHGTMMASIAAAWTDNGVGVAGVSWHSRILPVKTMASDGYGSYLAIAEGIRYAAENGAHVINLSVGGRNPSFILEDACEFAFGQGAVIVAAAGNVNSSVDYPAAYDDYCIAVAATDSNDERIFWSNYGPQVDVAAPGNYIWGAMFYPDEPGNLNSYGWGTGTSVASPIVSGAAALLIGYKPSLSNTQVMNLIKYTADDVNASTHPGVDDYLGYGRLNLRTLLGPYELNGQGSTK